MAFLIVPCAAFTKHERLVTLPTGSEVRNPETGASLSRADISKWTAAHPDTTHVRLEARCPGAQNFAPYSIDISDLWLALN